MHQRKGTSSEAASRRAQEIADCQDLAQQSSQPTCSAGHNACVNRKSQAWLVRDPNGRLGLHHSRLVACCCDCCSIHIPGLNFVLVESEAAITRQLLSSCKITVYWPSATTGCHTCDGL